jgi:hypothetical protein
VIFLFLDVSRWKLLIIVEDLTLDQKGNTYLLDSDH